MDKSIVKKQCTKCHRTKSLSDFYDKKKGRLGKDSYCKICRKAESANTYKSARRKRKPRKKGKSTHYGSTVRSIVADKFASHRKREEVLKEAGIKTRLPVNATEAELIAHADLIDETLKKAGLGDIRNDTKSSLQSCI